MAKGSGLRHPDGTFAVMYPDETPSARSARFRRDNPAGAAAIAARQRKRARDHVRGQKDAPCSDCGERYPHYVMDFDHVRGEKLFNVSAPRNKSDLSELDAEIAKCDLVCANCHRERTHGRR